MAMMLEYLQELDGGYLLQAMPTIMCFDQDNTDLRELWLIQLSLYLAQRLKLQALMTLNKNSAVKDSCARFGPPGSWMATHCRQMYCVQLPATANRWQDREYAYKRRFCLFWNRSMGTSWAGYNVQRNG